MKVKELIEKLSKVDQELEVRLYYSLGCGYQKIDVVFEDEYDNTTRIGFIANKDYVSYQKHKKLKVVE